MPEPTADALVADARRAVHEALVVLPAPEADRVRSLIADLETAVEGRTAMRFTSAPAAAPSADPAALRDSIAAALYERERPPRDPHWADAYPADREVFEAMADAVLPILAAPADRAAVLDQAADFFRGLTRTGTAITAAEVEAELRRMAVEAQPTQPQPNEMPRRGDQFETWLKAQRDEHRDTGRGVWTTLDSLLDQYRLHADTGTPLGEHACDGPHCDCSPAVVEPAEPADTQTPCGPAPSQCDAESGEPCANHEREQAHAEGEHCFCGPECDKACTCASAGDAFVPAGHYADCPQAAEAQQEGAQDRG